MTFVKGLQEALQIKIFSDLTKSRAGHLYTHVRQLRDVEQKCVR